VPVEILAGAHQDYVEDYPVCCHPMTLHIEIDPEDKTPSWLASSAIP